MLKQPSYRRAPAVVPLVAATACWGAGTVLTKQVLDDVAPLTLLPMQLTASCLLLFTITQARGQQLAWRAPTRRLAALGVLNPGLAYALGLLGLASITASMSVLLWAAEPVLIALFAVFLLRERFPARLLAALAVAVIGVLLVVYQPGTGGDVLGILLTLVAVGCCALYTVATRHLLLDDASLPVVLANSSPHSHSPSSSPRPSSSPVGPDGRWADTGWVSGQRQVPRGACTTGSRSGSIWPVCDRSGPRWPERSCRSFLCSGWLPGTWPANGSRVDSGSELSSWSRPPVSWPTGRLTSRLCRHFRPISTVRKRARLVVCHAVFSSASTIRATASAAVIPIAGAVVRRWAGPSSGGSPPGWSGCATRMTAWPRGSVTATGARRSPRPLAQELGGWCFSRGGDLR